ncbi:site-specific integrase [Monashia sp. NPDC004114]
MARPPLPLGGWGKIRTYASGEGKSRRWRAVTKYRDFDGVTRQVERTGRSAAAAETALKAALTTSRRTGRSAELTAADRFEKAAQLWLSDVRGLAEAGKRSPGTLEAYEGHLNRHVLPAFRGVRLGEITVPLIDRFLVTLRRKVGWSTAKSCRSVLSGVLGLAVRYGVLASNPIRDAMRVEGRPTRSPRALTRDERRALFTALAADPVAQRLDLLALTRFLLATGQRIGECLAVAWLDVDLDAAQVEVNHTVVRVAGHGLIRKDTKSSAGERTLILPSWAVADLRVRHARGVSLEAPVFPDTRGGLRDPSNTRRALRRALDRAGFDWVTSHNFRKTTATVLDDAGLSARLIADQLGHARPSMTQDVYMGRRAVDARAADALEDAVDF